MSRFRMLSHVVWHCQYHIIWTPNQGKSRDKSFKQFPKLKEKPYWGNHFWARGYCVDTIGFDPEKIRKYIKYREHKENLSEKKQQPKKR